MLYTLGASNKICTISKINYNEEDPKSCLYCNIFTHIFISNSKSVKNLFIRNVKNLYLNLACLSVWVSVCLYPINVKTAEPIGPKFFVGSSVTPGQGYEWSNFQKFASIKIRFKIFLKIHEIYFIKSAKLFVFVLLTRRTLMLFDNKEKPHVYK